MFIYMFPQTTKQTGNMSTFSGTWVSSCQLFITRSSAAVRNKTLPSDQTPLQCRNTFINYHADGAGLWLKPNMTDVGTNTLTCASAAGRRGFSSHTAVQKQIV
ncbi:hypothetical protein ATANTOWER_030911 [Ataeniobius toweri]|uniref:Uncharacterized protein n=1 Tax=Ataeniobius toweri TaxID=208326 RepID=A0ABU7AX99_9TELE|nr:hypothetical protein [Ataeniobius toweri]